MGRRSCYSSLRHLELFAPLHILDCLADHLPTLGGLCELGEEFVGRVPGAAAHWAIPLIRSSFGGLHSVSEDTKRVKYPEDLYCPATGGRSSTNL